MTETSISVTKASYFESFIAEGPPSGFISLRFLRIKNKLDKVLGRLDFPVLGWFYFVCCFSFELQNVSF